MFKGGSCYPITPLKQEDPASKDPNAETLIDSNDQLMKILDRINLNKKDVSFCSDDQHFNYINMMKQEVKPSA